MKLKQQKCHQNFDLWAQIYNQLQSKKTNFDF